MEGAQMNGEERLVGGEVVRGELARAVRQSTLHREVLPAQNSGGTSKSRASKRDQEVKGLMGEGLDGRAPLSPRALVDGDQLSSLAAA